MAVGDMAAADMDFVQEALEHEVPPPMQLDDIEELEARALAQRRAALDPELFGTAQRAEVPPGNDAPVEPGHHSPLRVRAFVRAFNRGLGYQDASRGPITDYLLPIGTAVGLGLEYYPAAHLVNDELAHLGVQVELHHSFLVESQGPMDISYPTTELAWHVGLRYRILLDDRGSQLAPELGAGQQRFRVERGGLDNASPAGVPYADYSYLRAGLAIRMNVGDFTLGGHAAYLPSFDLGAIGAELGGGFGHGVSAGVDFLYPLDFGFSFLVQVDARVFVLGFEDDPESRSAATGAIDHYVGVNVGIEWDMPSSAEL